MEQTVKCMRSPEIDIAKGIGIILVVLGHAVPDANTGIQNMFWAAVFNWIYSFHMALFMAMAGVLFFRKAVDCQSGEEKCRELKNRGGRLLAPYLFYSLLILAAKLVFSALSRETISVRSILEILFGNSPCGNMWFLWTLFTVSAIVLLIPKSNWFPLPLLIVSTALYFLQNIDIGNMDFGIGKICNMLVWFSLGMLLGKNIDKLNTLHKYSTSTKALLIISIVLVQILILKIRPHTAYPLIFKYLAAVSGIALTTAVSILCAECEGKLENILQCLGKNSMCIYVFSYFVQTPGVTLYRKLGSCGIPYHIWVIALTVFALLFADIITKIVRKNKVLKFILLGEK